MQSQNMARQALTGGHRSLIPTDSRDALCSCGDAGRRLLSHSACPCLDTLVYACNSLLQSTVGTEQKGRFPSGNSDAQDEGSRTLCIRLLPHFPNALRPARTRLCGNCPISARMAYIRAKKTGHRRTAQKPRKRFLCCYIGGGLFLLSAGRSGGVMRLFAPAGKEAHAGGGKADEQGNTAGFGRDNDRSIGNGREESGS